MIRPVTRRIRTELLIPTCLFLFGCGTASAPPKPTVAKASDRAFQVEKRIRQQTELVSELEIRMAMLESAVRELRAEASKHNQEKSTETIRIGRSSKSSTSSESLEDENNQRDDGNRRPVLRLYGANRPSSREEPIVLPEPPPSVPKTLSVVPLPKRDTVPLAAGKRQADASGNRDGLAEYRSALGFVRQRKYKQALQTLSEFTKRYPKSVYVDSAIYWRGEVYYATRAYREALEQFQIVTTRFPTSRKMPDSLLKIGMCHKRLGDFERARALFSRLLRQYPTSNAARVASLESSS